MKEMLKEEYNKNYIKENDVIEIERLSKLTLTDMMSMSYWTAKKVDGTTLVKADYYTNREIDTIERILEKEYKLVERIASSTNANIYSRV